MKGQLRSIAKRIYHRLPLLNTVVRKFYQSTSHLGCRRKVAGSNNSISTGNAILSSVCFDITGHNNSIIIGNDSFLHNVTFHLRGDGHRVVIGDSCRFNKSGNIWLEGSACDLQVGNHTTFEQVHFALTEQNSKVSVGEDCMFAYDIDVRTGDSHSIIDLAENRRINHVADVVIGNHVWIAAHVIVLKGVHISDNSVVASGSVVTRRFSDNGLIIGGNPARVIRQGITWSRKRIERLDQGQSAAVKTPPA